MGRKLIVASFTFSLFVFAWASPSTAEVILEVDVSDPNAAVFTSTGAFADNTVLNVDSIQGIFLEDFFSGNSGGGTDPGVAGALNVFDSTAGTTRSPLDAFFCCGGAFFFGPDDLNIYGVSGNFPMSFLDTEPAMTGSLTLDLIQPGDPVTGLPAPGVVGDVYAGGQDSSNIIGQWEVVPEATNGTVVTWSFQGNAYSGAIIGDLSGEVTITLDDEETPGSVHMRVDATALSDTGQDAITAIYLNTAFDSDSAFVQVAPTIGGDTYVGRANNEDGLSAGNTSPGFQDGPLFDLRLAFNTPGGGGDLLGVENPIFEATLTLTGGDLTVSDFFPQESTVNPQGTGEQGPFQVSLRAVQLPGGGDGYFAGSVPAPGLQIDDFDGGDDSVSEGGPTSSTTLYAGAVGNYRQLNFEDGDSPTDSLSVAEGTLMHSDAGTGFDSTSRIRWDGDGDGLGPADFTDGGAADRFLVDILAIGANDTLLFEVFDSTGDTAELLVTPGTAGLTEVFFSDFDLLTGIADFSEIFLLDVTINAENESSVEIDSIATVPEPTGGMLAALTTLACLRMLVGRISAGEGRSGGSVGRCRKT